MIGHITILFSILVLVGLLIPAYGQSSIANHVVINEVDINPPGDDSASPKEWVELYNPTENNVDIGGWKIASTTVLKQTLTIPVGTILEKGKFITYSYKTVWFTDTNEIVELRDNNGFVVDSTPSISDIKNDFTSWQRIYDGFDLDSADDWKFVTSTAGSTNGKPPISDGSEEVFVTISPSKSSYVFGETAVLTGSVSKEVYVEQLGDFKPESIKVSITGPNFNSEVLLYPDLNLNFKTSLSLQTVLGINEGIYNVYVTYAGVSSSTSFSVGEKITELTTPEEGTFTIVTDKSQYIPGETVAISGITSEVIPYEGLKYELKNPNGLIVETGTLYPVNGKFSGSIFLTTVKPVYGTYVLTGEYLGTSSVSFNVVADVKEDVLISLWTDKDVYSPGDLVTISGRLNNLWVSSLDLEILQTKNTALGVNDFFGGDYAFKIQDIVRLEGDSSFKYSFKIPKGDERLGDYRIKVSKEVGTAIKTIRVVGDSSEDILYNQPISITTDKPVYNFGDKITISGFVDDLSQSTTVVPVVSVSIKDKDGNPLTMIGGTGGGRLTTTGSSVSYDFTAIPEPSGRYSVTTELSRSVFAEGQYLVTAKYLKVSNSVLFTVSDVLILENGISASLNKEVYGLGEQVMLSGIIPRTGDAGVSITLTKPDGSATTTGTTAENQQFSWNWVTPISATKQTVKSTDDRSQITTNLGIYKIKVSNASFDRELFFKVSLDPLNDSLSTTPLHVFTEKSIYKAGEKLKVLGTVIKREQGDEGLVVPERVHLTIASEKTPTKIIHEASVYPDQGGNFQSTFELPITIFSEGQYKVKATYLKKQATYSFGVANDFVFGIDEPVTLLVSSDKSQYHPGDIAVITGKPNKLIYLEEYKVSIVKKTGQELTCGSFYCGPHQGPYSTIRPSPNGSFTYQFSIPDNNSSVGKYEVTVESDFETKKLVFDVVLPNEESLPQTIIEKQTSIPDDMISISTVTKEFDGVQAGPRVLLGSLVSSPRGEESNVNLRVTSASGICVIGQEDDCLVKDSTRKPGEIYDIVEIDGISMKVRYSGPDARVEKFSILPESPTAVLPDSIWDIEVVKDSQSSRLYYKINYSALE